MEPQLFNTDLLLKGIQKIAKDGTLSPEDLCASKDEATFKTIVRNLKEVGIAKMEIKKLQGIITNAEVIEWLGNSNDFKGSSITDEHIERAKKILCYVKSVEAQDLLSSLSSAMK